MLITDEYRALNAELHRRCPAYGTGGHRWARYVNAMCRKSRFVSVLDYGAGKGSLAKALPRLDVREYDPAVPGKDHRPQSADLVICADVLEHVEIECMREVLADIVSLADKAVLLSISCRVGQKKLADGRPAHITVRSPEWWADFLIGFGRFKPIESGPDEYNVVMRK